MINREQIEASARVATERLVVEVPNAAVLVAVYPSGLGSALMMGNMPPDVRLDFVRSLLAQLEQEAQG